VTRVTFLLTPPRKKGYRDALMLAIRYSIGSGVGNNWHCASWPEERVHSQTGTATTNAVESADASRAPSRFMLPIVMMRDDGKRPAAFQFLGHNASIPCLCRSGVPGCTSPRSSLLCLTPYNRLSRPPCGLCEFTVKIEAVMRLLHCSFFLQSVL
jgi:hypothetical protein